MTLNDLITKSYQTTWFVVADLEQALGQADHQAKAATENAQSTLADRSLVAYLADTLALARKLRSDLERIAG